MSLTGRVAGPGMKTGARAGSPGAPDAPPAVATRRRKALVEDSHENEDRWLLTYADMITLLLVLFVVLFALSSINASKFQSFRQGLTSAFDPSAIISPGGNGLLGQTSLQSQLNINQTVSRPPSLTQAARAQMNQIASAVQTGLLSKRLQNFATVTTTSKGVVVQILADKVFFASGVANLGPTGDSIVDTIANTIGRYPNDVQVEGYTDNQPIAGGLFTSNWELSAVRAANVADRLDVVDHIGQNRLSSVGYGETRPVASNVTAFGRAENRRIDVVILGK